MCSLSTPRLQPHSLAYVTLNSVTLKPPYTAPPVRSSPLSTTRCTSWRPMAFPRKRARAAHCHPEGQMPSSDSQPSIPDTPQGPSIMANRPKWAGPRVPDWLVTLSTRPGWQLAILLPLYVFHLLFISKKVWHLPVLVAFADDKGMANTIGLDSIVGLATVVVSLIWRKAHTIKPLAPDLLQSASPPWKVPRETKPKLLSTTVILVVAYLASGYGALFCEQVLCICSGYGVPLTVPTMRAWKVLLGHLMWVFMGIKILGQRLKPFFPPKGTWLRWKWKSNWLWWAIGGYAVSSLLFNCADVVNQLVLPASVFSEETVVSKLVNPENRDLVAMAVGSIGPCISAPVFEEVLYRGFLLPALAAFLPLWVAIPVSSVLFAVHHLSLSGILPLTILGLAWAIIYTQSGNLLVTILIHCMWNSRVFLVSLLGL